MIYTNETKMNIINRLDEGDSIQELCSAYGISRSTLYRWMHDGDKSISDSENVQGPSIKDYRMLQHKIEKLENVIAILKAVNCTIHAPLKGKLSELELLCGQYDVHRLRENISMKINDIKKRNGLPIQSLSQRKPRLLRSFFNGSQILYLGLILVSILAPFLIKICTEHWGTIGA